MHVGFYTYKHIHIQKCIWTRNSSSKEGTLTIFYNIQIHVQLITRNSKRSVNYSYKCSDYKIINSHFYVIGFCRQKLTLIKK